MTTDPNEFLRETFPALFKKGVAKLRTKADGGDARATATLADITGAKGAAMLHVEDGATLWYTVDDGALTVHEAAPDGYSVTFAVAAPVEALSMLLAEADGEGLLDDDRAAIRAARTTSKRIEDALAGQEITLHLIVTDVPDIGDVTARIGLGVDEPPAEPGFTATIKYDDLESAREGNIDAQQLFMQGKIRLAGNYAPAMQLAMQLMQPKQ